MSEHELQQPIFPSIKTYAEQMGLENLPHGIQLREHGVALSVHRAAIARRESKTEEELHRGTMIESTGGEAPNLRLEDQDLPQMH